MWLKEKKDISELRRKLHSASDNITVLIVAAMGKSNLLNESVKQATEQIAQLRLMHKKLDAQAATSDLIVFTAKLGVNHIIQVHSIAVDMKSVLALWQDDPVTLEDALGFLVRIPLELVNSWDVRIACTSKYKRFEKHPGHTPPLNKT